MLHALASRLIDTAMRAGNHQFSGASHGGGRDSAAIGLLKLAPHPPDDDSDDQNEKKFSHVRKPENRAPSIAELRSNPGLRQRPTRADRQRVKREVRDAGRKIRENRNDKRELVGVRGFEPPTPASRTQYSTRLSYTPTEGFAVSEASGYRESR